MVITINICLSKSQDLLFSVHPEMALLGDFCVDLRDFPYLGIRYFANLSGLKIAYCYTFNPISLPY